MGLLGCGFLFHIRYRIVAAVVAGVIAMLVLSAIGYADAQTTNSTNSTLTPELLYSPVTQDFIDYTRGNYISIFSLILLLVMSAAFTIAYMIGKHPIIIFFSIASLVVSILIALVFLTPYSIADDTVTSTGPSEGTFLIDCSYFELGGGTGAFYIGFLKEGLEDDDVFATSETGARIFTLDDLSPRGCTETHSGLVLTHTYSGTIYHFRDMDNYDEWVDGLAQPDYTFSGNLHQYDVQFGLEVEVKEYLEKDSFLRQPLGYLFFGKALFDGLYGILLITDLKSRGLSNGNTRRD